jgi:DUF1680 family protein
MAASSILEPMVRLYNITKKNDYLKFAEYIVQSWNSAAGPELVTKALQNIPVGERYPIPKNWFGPLNGRKAYEMMSCYEGLLELYRITGNPNYLQAVKNTAESIRQNEIFITGSGATIENWYNGAAIQATPALHPQETCVSATWMKLCFQLLRTTGDAKWANEIEKTFYNALLAAMKPDGRTWNQYTEIMGVKHLGEDQCGMLINCCIASGPRGMMVLPKEAFMTTQNGVVVNFYTSATANLFINKNKSATLSVQTEYPKTNEIVIQVEPSGQNDFDVLLRLPDWSSNNIITVNGQIIKPDTWNGYAVLNRNWKKGDVIKLTLDMAIREFTVKSEPTKFALLYGPLVLASDNRYQSDPFYLFYNPVKKQGQIPFEIMKTNKNADVYMELKTSFNHEIAGGNEQKELTLIDLASSGNTWDSKSAYLFWFQRPLDFRIH